MWTNDDFGHRFFVGRGFGFNGMDGYVQFAGDDFEMVAPQGGRVLVQALAGAEVVLPTVAAAEDLVPTPQPLGNEVRILMFAGDFGGPEAAVAFADDGDQAAEHAIGLDADLVEIAHVSEANVIHRVTIPVCPAACTLACAVL